MSNLQSISEEDKTAFERERDRLHAQMLSAVSHDLKTPLAAIIGSLEIHTRFKENLTAEKKQVLLDTALQEAYRLDSFITNILDMSKLDNNFVNVRKQKTDIKLLLEDCCAKMTHLLQKSDFQIVANDDKNFEIYTDSALFIRAVSCLLDNAIKHAGEAAAIKVVYGHRGQNIFVSIVDNGPGIPAEKQDIVFNKYTRLAKQDHQNAGTGLGLAICKSVMHLLGGAVAIENISEPGSCFTLTFDK